MCKKEKRKNRSRRIKRQKEEALGRSSNQFISKREEGGLYNHTVQYTLKYSSIT
jgi:hypothetical protein